MADSPMPDVGQPVQILPSDLFAQSGVYFLHYQGEVVYVGQAANMRKRIGQHLTEAVKLFDSVSCRPCPPNWLLKRERYFITKLSPKYNRCGVSKFVQKMVDAGWEERGDDLARAADDAVDHVEAAAFLGVEPWHLKLWIMEKKGPRKLRSRKHRGGGFLRSHLQKFAEENAELIAAAQAEAQKAA